MYGVSWVFKFVFIRVSNFVFMIFILVHYFFHLIPYLKFMPKVFKVAESKVDFDDLLRDATKFDLKVSAHSKNLLQILV